MIYFKYGRGNRKLPKASSIRDIKPDIEDAFVNLVVADIEAYTSKNNKAVKKTLTIPAWLNDIAEKEGVNFSQILQSALKEKLHIEV